MTSMFNTFGCFASPGTLDKWSALADKRGLERMCFLLDPADSEEVCDVGTGRGAACGAIARHTRRVVTFDVADQGPHIAKLGLPNVEFRRADLSPGDLPCEDASFDIIICRAALHHLADKARFLQEAFRVLRVGGRLYIMDPVMSPELRLAWSVMSRITERDYKSYVTEEELFGGIKGAGLGLSYVGRFLFPRSLKQLIDERLPEVDANKDNDFVSHVRKSVWESVHQLFSSEMHDELHLSLNSPEGWFAYNCVELIAHKL